MIELSGAGVEIFFALVGAPDRFDQIGNRGKAGMAESTCSPVVGRYEIGLRTLRLPPTEAVAIARVASDGVRLAQPQERQAAWR